MKNMPYGHIEPIQKRLTRGLNTYGSKNNKRFKITYEDGLSMTIDADSAEDAEKKMGHRLGGTPVRSIKEVKE